MTEPNPPQPGPANPPPRTLATQATLASAAPQQHAAPATPGRPGEPVGEKIGEMIGPYKLLEALGEGGFGSVWLAERRDPVVQRVALKIMKAGMDSKAVLARFDQERQALALMNHPNIARMFDAGTSVKGRPYFVMEFVQGDPITDYCKKHKLTLRERLELMLPVCEAVQHAHMRGLIHRDLKPGNILVTRPDDRATPKIIDFGIAKALTHTLTDQTIHTEQGTLIGTPEYMSPEQTEWGRNDIDTRADVYSLGVVLYEVLTGVLPFDSAQLRAGGYEGMRHLIREVDPPRPSVRVSTIIHPGSSEAVKAKVFGDDARTVMSVLKGDLDWITMKALEKERTRRYESASALANDIRAYLDNRPVEARPPTITYRTSKWVRRNKPLAAGAGVLALATLATAGGVVYGLVQAKRGEKAARVAETLAKNEAQRANTEAQRANAVSRFVTGMLKLSNAGVSKPGDLSVLDIVNQSAQMLDAGAMSDQPEAASVIRQELAVALRNFQELPAAREQASRAVEFERSRKPQPDAEKLGKALSTLGLIQYDSRGEGPQLLADSTRTLHEAVEALAAMPAGSELRTDTANYYALALRAAGKTDEAAEVLQRTLTDLEGAGKSHTPHGADIAQTLATMRNGQGRFVDAVAMSDKAGDITRKVYGDSSRQLAITLTDQGVIRHNVGRLADAEKSFREGLAIWDTLNMRQQSAAHLLRNYGSLLLDMGRVDEARKAAEEAVAIRAATVGEQHAGYADALDGMGDVLRIAGDLAGAESKFRDAVKIRADLPVTTPLDLARSQIGLAETLVARSQFAEARELALASLNARRAALPQGHPWITHARGILGCAMAGLGESASARDELLQAAEAMRKDPGTRSYRATMILTALKAQAERAGDAALASQCARDIDGYRDRGR